MNFPNFQQFLSTCLILTSVLYVDSQSTCSCSKITESAEIKCPLQTEDQNPRCTVAFEQANNDFSHPHTKCIGKNTFSTLGEYSGQLRKAYISCTAPYPLDVNFDGMLPHQSIGIAFFRSNHDEDGNGLGVTSSVVVSMDVEPEMTGKYTVYANHNKMMQTSLYIFAESRTSGPYWMHYGKTLQAEINDRKIILPCRLFNPTIKVFLRKVEINPLGYVTKNLETQYDPQIGFIIDKKGINLVNVIGVYECMIKEHPEEGNRIVVRVDDPNKVIQTTDTSNSLLEPDLSLNVSGKWASCTSNSKKRGFSLVNMRAKNPSESRMKKFCFNGEEECLGKREGSFNRCYSNPKYCRSVDFKEGGGLISCFFRNTQLFKDPQDYVLGLDGKTYLSPDTKNVPLNALIQISVQEKNDSKFYTGIVYNFACTVVSYLFAQPIRMYLQFGNGSTLLINAKDLTNVPGLKEINDISSKKIIYNNYKTETPVTFNTESVKGVVCSAFEWKSNELTNFTYEIDVYESRKPSFKMNSASVDFLLGQTNELTCDVVALPMPKIEWKKDDKTIFGTTTSNQTLYISNAAEKDAGAYICVATNALGSATKSYFVQVIDAPTGPGHFVTIGIPIILLLIGVAVCAALIRYYRRTRKGLSRQEIDDFLNGLPPTDNNKSANSNDYESFITTIPYPKEYEIIDGKFHIDEDKMLGSGAYGVVYKGSMDGRSEFIAIKTLKRNADLSYLRSLLAELKVMIHLKEHPHIVNLVGANTQHLNKGYLHIMVELCPFGSLESYLRKHRDGFVNELLETDYANSPTDYSVDFKKESGYANKNFFTDENLKTTDLVTWSYQIASGMEYLASKNVIHGDLAARNILLQQKTVAKISDFGLSRKMYEYSNYVKKSQEPLPWRYMALESLRDLDFSTKSDVWAYGVTLWEIYSLGEVPYPGLNWDVDFVNRIENGLRMKQPKYCNYEIYDIQLNCWKIDVSKRPTFTFLKDFFRRQMMN